MKEGDFFKIGKLWVMLLFATGTSIEEGSTWGVGSSSLSVKPLPPALLLQ